MKIIKEGGESIILGTGYISPEFIHEYKLKPCQLLRITKYQNTYITLEHKIYKIIETIPNNCNMYSIPNTNPIKLTTKQKIYHEIDKLIKKNKYTTLNPLPETILLYEIPYAGEYELLDTIKRIDIKSIKIRPSIKNIPKIWIKYQDIIDFASQIITALKYLHRNNIAHLDIKPENIMVEIYKNTNLNTNQNTNQNTNNKFRLIDFGYSSIYPFTDYLENMRGTPDYFPQHFEDQSSPAPYLPKIISNDTEINPETKNINLFTKIDYIYKIDSFCLGRVLYLLRYFYQNYYERHLIQNEKHQPNTNKKSNTNNTSYISNTSNTSNTSKILRKLFGSSKAKKNNQNHSINENPNKLNLNKNDKKILNELIEKLLDDNIHNRYYIKDIILS